MTRLFDVSEVTRLGFIRAAKHLGFTLEEIRQITARADGGHSPCPDVRALMRERIVSNRARLDAMLTQQARMEAALAAWEEMPHRVPDGDSVCHCEKTSSGALSATRGTMPNWRRT